MNTIQQLQRISCPSIHTVYFSIRFPFRRKIKYMDITDGWATCAQKKMKRGMWIVWIFFLKSISRSNENKKKITSHL